MQLTARIWPEQGGFVAEYVELKVVTAGDTEDAALSNLREAVEGFLECADPSEVRERMHAGTRVRTFDVAVSYSAAGRHGPPPTPPAVYPPAHEGIARHRVFGRRL